MPYVILHDTRLMGRPEAGLGTVVEVDANTPLTTGLSRAVSAASQSGTELVIACHGYMTHNYNHASNIELRGGQGLQLCRESLMVSNVSTASILAGFFSKVWLMACGPAGTIVNPSRPFCRELAFYVDAPVVASDHAQTYYPGDNDAVAKVCREVLRFGKWEGNVFLFTPDGNVSNFTSGETPLP